MLPETMASFAPVLIWSMLAFPPSKKDNAPIKIDLPAPVSPVKTVNPFEKSILS